MCISVFPPILCPLHSASNEPGPSEGLHWLKGTFFLSLLLLGRQAVGFYKALGDNFDCDRCHINKVLTCFRGIVMSNLHDNNVGSRLKKKNNN